ncbi:MAG: PAS domain-containing protein [Burkholderiales bacterium]
MFSIAALTNPLSLLSPASPRRSDGAVSSALPWLVLVIALVVSIGAWQWRHYDRTFEASQRADLEARRVLQEFESRLTSAGQAVRGIAATAGLARPLTRNAWESYVDGLKLHETFGDSIVSVIFAERVGTGDLDEHLARWRRIDPAYRIGAGAAQAVRYPIVLASRAADRPGLPFGFDAFTGSRRQAAAQRALAQRDVSFMQGLEPASSGAASAAAPSVVVIAPVFASTGAARESGFAGIEFRPELLLRRIVGTSGAVRATLTGGADGVDLLRSQVGDDAASASPESTGRTGQFDRGGWRWTLTVGTVSPVASSEGDLGLLGTLLGVSLILFYAARRLDRVRTRASGDLPPASADADTSFRAFVEDGPFLIWLADETLQLTYVNAVWTGITGRPIREALGRAWHEVIHPDDLPELVKTFQALVDSPSSCTVRARMQTRDRGYRWFMASVRPRVDAGGTLEGFIGISADVHDIPSVAEARAEGNARLAEVLDAIPVPVCAKNGDGVWVFANRAAAAFHGVPVEQLTGRRNDQLWADSCAGMIGEQDGVALDSGAAVQTEELHQRIGGGEPAWVLKTKQSVTTPDGRRMEIVTVVDVSERRATQDAFERERALLKGILDGAPACIFAKDGDHRYVLLNGEIERFMGVRSDRFLGRSDRDFFPPDEVARNEQQDDAVLREGRTVRSEDWFSDPSGRKHWVLKIKCPVALPSGERMLVGWVLDITDRKREELDLLASKEQLALLHDLATTSVAGADVDTTVTTAVSGLARAVPDARVAFAAFEGNAFENVSWRVAHADARPEPGQAPELGRVAGLVSRLVAGETVACDDTAATTEWADAAAYGVRAFLAVPVRGRTRQRGAFLVDTLTPRRWSARERQLLEEVADALAAALDAEATSRQRDAALREAEAGRDFLDSLVNALPNPLFVKDREHRLVLVNDEFVQWAGQAREALIGHVDDKIVAEGRAAESWKEDELAFANRGEHLTEIVSRLPHARARNILQCKTVVTLGDGKQYLVGTTIPIDDLVAARERAEASERFLDAILDAVPQPLFVKDRDHRWVRMNRAFADVVGLPREQLLGRKDAEVMREDLAEIAYREDDNVIKTGEAMVKEVQARTAQGVGRWVQSSKARAVMEDGTPYIVGVVSDIQPLKDERHRAEESERFLAQVLDALPIPIVAKDEQSRWVLANATYLQQCGLTREAALGRTDVELFGEAEGGRIEAQDRAVLAGGESLVVEEPFHLRGAEARWILKTKLVVGRPGERRLVLTSSVDITERREAEIAMRRSREFLDAVLQTLPVAVVVKDHEHRYVVANEEVLKFLDRTPQSMIGKSDADIYDAQTASANVAEDDRLLASLGHLQTEQQYFLKNGAARWVLKSKRAFRLDGGETYIIVSLIDIDERKRAEIALESNRQFLDIVVNAIPNGVAVKGETSRYLMGNRAFAEWCGRDQASLVGLQDEDIVDAETAKRNRAEDAEVLRTGRSLAFEARMRRSDGRESFWLKHKTLVNLPDGQRHILAVATDITDRKALEAQAVTARHRLEMLNRLSARTLAGDSPQDLRTFAAHALTALLKDTRVTVASVDESGLQHALVTVGDGAPFAVPVAPESRVDVFPDGWTAMRGGRLITLSAMQHPGPTEEQRQRLAHAGVRALIAAPMRRRHRLHGVVVVESWRDRLWSGDEIQMVTDITDALTAAVEFCDSVVERARAEDALRASKALLTGIINALPTGIVVKDESGQWVIGNEAMVRITGRTLEEVIGRTNIEIYGPDIGGALDAEDEETLARTDPVSVEWRVMSPNTTNPWVVKTKSQLVLPDGRRYLISALSDVTPQKEAAMEVERSRRFLDALLNALPQAVYVRDESGRAILANTAYYQLTRRTPGEVMGRTNDEMFDEETARVLDAQDREAWDSGHVVYFEQETRDARISAEWQLKSKAPVSMPDGSRYLVCTSSDITQLKRAVTSVERSKQFVETLINAVPQAIFVKDEEGRWIMVNEPFLRFGDYKLVNLLGRTNREIYGPEVGARFDQQDAVAWASSEPIVYEEEAPEAEFGRRWQLKSKSAVRLSDGSRYLVCTATDVTDRRESEIALQRNRQFLHAIVDAVPMPIFVKDEQHRLTIVNTAAEQMHQRPKSELIGKTDFDLHDDAYATATWTEDEEVLAHGGILNSEIRMEFENQAPRWIMKSKVATTLDDGSRYTVAALLDITERKRAEQDALDARARLEVINGISSDMASGAPVAELVPRAVTRLAAILPGLNVSLWTWLRPGVISLDVFVGPDGGELATGYTIDVSSMQEFVTRLMSGEILVIADTSRDPLFRDRPASEVVRLIGAVVDAPIRGAAGTPARGVLSVSSRGPREWSEHERQTVTEVSDALMLAYLQSGAETERARVEQELRDNEATLRATVWASDLGLWSWDLVSNSVHFSPRWKAQIGFAPEELADSFDTWRERVHPDDLEPASAAVQSALGSSSERYQAEFRLRHKDGSWRNILARAQIQRSADGAPLRMVGGHIDVTDFRRAQEALRRHRDELEHLVSERTAEAVRAKELAEAANLAKSEFLANMSHELRTPMHAILSFSKLGLDRMGAGEPQLPKIGTYLERIQQSGQRLLSLLNDLLDLSKLEAGKMRYDFADQDLREVAGSVVTELSAYAKEREVRIAIRSPETPIRTICDAVRIGQVVRNLLSNAIKFTEPGRAVTVEVEGGHRIDGVDGLAVEAAVVRVRDEGVGIPESELEAVFDKFVQSSKTKSGAGGTGLGLAISREIVGQHGGRIWAENNADRGASFTLLLPVTGRAADGGQEGGLRHVA